ncbi:hypothetical protein CGMCC3_g18096 [Colletotrichum fructicola]|nr:uncharacterized protein CGMCC3_g18096 [Colletotrichum fructicola]KAE9565721.1 hypothetical protein CGMCC3_g18096 [Colletotrichum fructicola]
MSGLFPASSAYYHGADTGHREALHLRENLPQSLRHELDFLCFRNPPLPRDDIPKRELTKPWTSESEDDPRPSSLRRQACAETHRQRLQRRPPVANPPQQPF